MVVMIIMIYGYRLERTYCTEKKLLEGSKHFFEEGSGGPVVEPRTPEREVGGSIPTFAVLSR